LYERDADAGQDVEQHMFIKFQTEAFKGSFINEADCKKNRKRYDEKLGNNGKEQEFRFYLRNGVNKRRIEKQKDDDKRNAKTSDKDEKDNGLE